MILFTTPLHLPNLITLSATTHFAPGTENSLPTQVKHIHSHLWPPPSLCLRCPSVTQMLFTFQGLAPHGPCRGVSWPSQLIGLCLSEICVCFEMPIATALPIQCMWVVSSSSSPHLSMHLVYLPPQSPAHRALNLCPQALPNQTINIRSRWGCGSHAGVARF